MSADDCISKCLECLKTCQATLAYCLTTDSKMAAGPHITLMLDCIDCCVCCLGMLSRGSSMMKVCCTMCAACCLACAKECGTMGDDRMTACADACRQCAAACKSLK